MLSANSIVSVFTVVVVPETVKSPDTVKSLNVTSDVVATGCPIDIAPALYVTPVPPESLASTLALVKNNCPLPSVISSVSGTTLTQALPLYCKNSPEANEVRVTSVNCATCELASPGSHVEPDHLRA